MISSDVVLGLSTTFFGGFIGCIPDIVRMIAANTLTMIIFFYFALILAATMLKKCGEYMIDIIMEYKTYEDVRKLLEEKDN